MDPLEKEIAAYEARREELDQHHNGKWVVFHDEEFVGAFDTFESAAAEAVRRFDRGASGVRSFADRDAVDGPLERQCGDIVIRI